jgi:hypothetical protein
MWWEAKQKQLTEAFREVSIGSASPGKSRRKSNRDSSVSDNEVSGDGRPSPKRNQRRKANKYRESLSSDNESGAESGLGMRQPKNNCVLAAKVTRRTNKQNATTTAVSSELMET